MEIILAERRENSKEDYVSDQELIDDIKTFVLAGSETSSNFLVALVFYVFECPEVAARLRKEIE